MSKDQSDIHRLYHEAKRRAGRPQPLSKYKEANSLLLSAPNNIIFELFNTIIREISAELVVSFIENNLRSYLSATWSNKITKQAVKRLKREQTVDVRAGLKDVPAIKSRTSGLPSKSPMNSSDLSKGISKLGSDKTSVKSETEQSRVSTRSKSQTRTSKIDSSKTDKASSAARVASQKNSLIETDTDVAIQVAIDHIYDHVMWRVRTNHVTQITSLLIKLVLDDGYKKGKLKVEAYSDVLDSFSDWRSGKLIKLYSFGCAPANDQKLILANTTAGDLTRWVANYIDGSEKRQKPDLIRILATALRDKTKNCILITNELIDALKSLETGAIRCVILVDRLNQYDYLEAIPEYSTQIRPLVISGKLFFVSSLGCVMFAPDPSNDTCC